MFLLPEKVSFLARKFKLVGQKIDFCPSVCESHQKGKICKSAPQTKEGNEVIVNCK